jgi:hypothetical protein
MKRCIFITALIAVAFGVAACNDAGSKPVGPTSRPFEEIRDDLAARLDTIKVNIASVPADIQTRIKATCRELETYIGKDKTTEICDTLDEALDRADPGRIDRVLTELAQLQP